MKTKHTGKLFAFLLALVMMFGIMPMTANAVTVITSVSATVTEPVAGATPASTATFNSSEYTIDSVFWRKGGSTVDTSTGMVSGEKFKAGETYCVTIRFRAKDGFRFGSEADPNALTATFNGKTATYYSSEWSGEIMVSAAYYAAFTVPAALTPLSFTAVSNFTVPIAGASPDYDVTLTTAALSTTQKIASVSWIDVSANKSIYKEDNYKFEAGHTYKVTFHLEPLGDNRFTSSPECTVRPVSGTILTTRMSVDNSYYAPDDGTGRAGSFTYFVEGTSITTVKLSGLDLPERGKTPDQSISVSGSTCTNELVYWQDITGSSTVSLSATDKFVSGHTYMLSLALKPANYNYYFKDDGDDDMTYSHPNGITINGLPLSSYTLYKAPNVDSYRDYSNFGGDLRLHITFSIPGEVSDFEITNLTAPVHGVAADYSASVANTGFTVKSIRYGIRTTGLTSGDPYTGNAGDNLEIGVTVEASDGYTFSTSPTPYWNGIKGTSYKMVSMPDNQRYFVFKYTVPTPAHIHNYTGVWKSDATNHWQICSCGEKGNTAAHTYGAWKVTKAATETATGSRERVCAVCGYKQTEVIPMLSHTHNYTGAWKSDATNHWQLCSCGEKGNTAAHSYGAWKVTKAATETADGSRERTCAVCGYKQTEVIPMLSHTHAYGTEWKNDDTQHWHECDCGDKSDTAAHTFGEWTVTKEATEAEEGLKNRTCSACGYVESAVIPVLGHEHSYTEEWKSDSENHWNECDCGEVSNQAAHTYGEWETVKEATATEEGVRKRACTVCGYEEYEAITVNGTESTASSEPATSEPATTESTPTDPTPTDPEKPDDSFPWWIIIVAVVAVGGIAVVVIIIVKKKKQM